MASPTEASCTICKEPAAKHCPLCAIIKDDGSIVPATFYCSEACQKKDWKAHKLVCTPVVALYRGAKLLQEVFYAFCRVTFDRDISHIKLDGSEIHFYDRAPTKFIFDFPDDLVAKPEDKKALLTYDAHGDASIFLSTLFTRLFKGMPCQHNYPQEVSLPAGDVTSAVVRHRYDGKVRRNVALHDFWVVKMKKGGSYVIDPAGAQFRQYSPVLPLDVYNKAYGSKYVSNGSVGFLARAVDEVIERGIEGSVISLVYNTSNKQRFTVRTAIHNAMHNGIDAWEEKAGKTVAEMLKGKNSVFEKEEKELFSAIDRHLRGSVELFKAQGGNGDYPWHQEKKSEA